MYDDSALGDELPELFELADPELDPEEELDRDDEDDRLDPDELEELDDGMKKLEELTGDPSVIVTRRASNYHARTCPLAFRAGDW